MEAYLVDPAEHEDGVDKHDDVANDQLQHVEQDGLLVQVPETAHSIRENVVTFTINNFEIDKLSSKLLKVFEIVTEASRVFIKFS